MTLGYVAVELDNMMHSSANYRYLYSNTKNWIEEEETVANIRHLKDRGYKVYITTDHGNIDATAYKKLNQRDKLGADLSLRHITLPDAADKNLFEAEYGEHVVQMDSDSKINAMAQMLEAGLITRAKVGVYEFADAQKPVYDVTRDVWTESYFINGPLVSREDAEGVMFEPYFRYLKVE